VLSSVRLAVGTGMVGLARTIGVAIADDVFGFVRGICVVTAGEVCVAGETTGLEQAASRHPEITAQARRCLPRAGFFILALILSDMRRG
jgi:hypothetical protein